MKVGLLALSPESWSHLATAKEEWKSAGDPPFKEILISASTVVTSSVDLNSHRSQRKIQRFSRKDFQDSIFLWESLEKYRDTDRGIIHHCKNCRDFFTNSWCRRNVWKALAILWNSAWDFLITMPWQKRPILVNSIYILKVFTWTGRSWCLSNISFNIITCSVTCSCATGKFAYVAEQHVPGNMIHFVY